jgi:hypothetical protein
MVAGRQGGEFVDQISFLCPRICKVEFKLGGITKRNKTNKNSVACQKD